MEATAALAELGADCVPLEVPITCPCGVVVKGAKGAVGYRRQWIGDPRRRHAARVPGFQWIHRSALPLRNTLPLRHCLGHGSGKAYVTTGSPAFAV